MFSYPQNKYLILIRPFIHSLKRTMSTLKVACFALGCVLFTSIPQFGHCVCVFRCWSFCEPVVASNILLPNVWRQRGAIRVAEHVAVDHDGCVFKPVWLGGRCVCKELIGLRAVQGANACCSLCATKACCCATTADFLVNNGYVSTTNARKIMQSIGTLGPAVCLLYLAFGNAAADGNVAEAAVAMTGVVALTGFQSGGYASNHQDISSKYAAVLFGITNALNALMGFVSVYATGVILDATGQSWSIVWFLVAAWYIAGASVYLRFASSEPQFD